MSRALRRADMHSFALFAALIAFALCPGVVERTAAAVEADSLPTSESALRSEEALRAMGEPEERTLPAGHWLEGTSDAADMVPAVVAPEAERELLAEYGPAFLERIGELRVLHLKGSYYDMGYQHGTLMKEEIEVAANVIRLVGAVAWKGDFVESSREAWRRASPYIPDKLKDEMRGLADATGLTMDAVQEFTIFPELFHCSGFAVWGEATADGALLHGRVLDYMRDVGFDRFALTIIQQPDGANAFVNVAYSGMLGSVTGMNLNHVAIGEMGGGGAEQWDGMPMTFLIRECLESAGTLEDVRVIMKNTPRTCEYFYVVSDSKADGGRGSAFGVGAVPERIEFIGPNEYHPLLQRPVPDAVLLSAGDRYQTLVDRVEKMHGAITPQVALEIMARGVAMRSNMHNVLFRPATLELWIANSTVQEPASNRPYTRVDVRRLMESRPTTVISRSE